MSQTRFSIPIAICLLLAACDKQSDSQVNNTTTITEDSLILFDETSMQTQQTAWRMPPSQLNLHREERSTITTIGDSVSANAAPFGIIRGGVGSSSVTIDVDGYIANALVASYNPPAIFQETTGFLGATSQSRYIARGLDGALYTVPPFYGNQLHLPVTISVGTTWRSDMDMSASPVGRVFVYTSIGQIHFQPTVRTIAVPLSANDDPELTAPRKAVTTGGMATDDLSLAAIDYHTANAYRGTWLDVRRIGSFTVIATNVISPQLHLDNCIKVQLRLTYQIAGERPVGYTQTIGLDGYQGAYELYWKPHVGWVEWSGSETMPTLGMTNMPSATTDYGYYQLSTYNTTYDQAMLGSMYGGIPYSLPYSSVFADGYYAGYQDDSPSLSYYAPAPRRNLNDAQTYYRAFQGCSDTALLTDNGAGRGRLAVIDAAFAAGYALGTQRYIEDFTAIPNDYDTLNTGHQNRQSVTMQFNKVPEAFRPSGAYRIGADLAPTVMADAWSTGQEYPNGPDGLGTVVDAWDPTITSGTNAIRRQLDANGAEIRRVYIALPILGFSRTLIISGKVTESGVVSSGDG